ncbi:MAG TPA: MaoC family dehydratase N-terminal domain-containing protein [Dehalococcoidia bacterium]|nr:MaoC family dehydratase N-terminal domain-containing protein [Dehalococcoidia bacterium]
MESVITDDIRSYIGRTFDPVVHEVPAAGIRAFARAVGYRDPVFYDEEHARGVGHRGLVAPPGYLGTPVYNPNARPANPLRLPDLPVKRRLNGGTDLEYFGEVCAGDVLKATSRIKDIAERPGRSGPMVMIAIETEYKNRDGQMVARQTTTLIRY